MDFEITNVDYGANQWEVTKAIAAVLHTEDDFLPRPPTARLLNFKVSLRSSGLGVRNDGTGTLTLPSHKVCNWTYYWILNDTDHSSTSIDRANFFVVGEEGGQLYQGWDKET